MLIASASSRIRCIVPAAAVALVAAAATPPALAIDCVAVPGTVCPASSTSTPAPLVDLGAGVARPAIAAPTGDAPAPEALAPLPFAMKKSDSAVSVRAGLADIGAYQERALQRKIDGVKAHLPADAKLPKPVAAPKPALDVWTRVEANGLDDGTGNSGSAVKTSVGADYRLGGLATTGVSAERSEPATGALAGAPAQDDKLAGYLTLQAGAGLSIDTRAQWQTARPEPSAGPDQKSTFSVAPRLGHRFGIDASGTTLEPYVTMKHELDIAGSSAPTGSALSASNSAGAGVTLARPDAYSLGVSTSVDDIDKAEPASVSSKLQLKVPLE